jgi:hypothetical protein
MIDHSPLLPQAADRSSSPSNGTATATRPAAGISSSGMTATRPTASSQTSPNTRGSNARKVNRPSSPGRRSKVAAPKDSKAVKQMKEGITNMSATDDQHETKVVKDDSKSRSKV